MTLLMEAKTIPLSVDQDGVVRVSSTRVTLDTVVTAFQMGETPEGIVQQFPSLNLADVYQVIGYYLHQTEDVEAYLRHRQEQATKVQRENEAKFDPAGIRDRLLARQQSPRD